MSPARAAAFPDGHFYSPVTDPYELEARRGALWREDPELPGIDLNDAMHEQILGELFPAYIGDYDYPEVLPESPELTDFFTRNSQFSWLDARLLFVLLRAWSPRRLVEVGSGFSSLLVADVNRRFLNGALDATCVEPYPRPFLARGIPGITRLITAKAQDVSLDVFTGLEAGDVLFVDSSHVSKTGSDVNYLYLEVFPRLAPGVRIHIHDIFLPDEYPEEWVLGENRSWNEQYLLRALLTCSDGFRVLFGCSYAASRHPELVRRALGRPNGPVLAGGSFWIERVGRSEASGA